MIKIKTFVPSYFEKFRCIAGKCPDTCCIGWEVDIDDETAEKYSALSGQLSDKIKKHLTVDETGCNIFTLCDKDRCPFLDKNNLCEIFLGAGENYLSKTCTLFPRFFDNFGNFREMGLGFGCPEAARIILEDEENFSLKLYEETDESYEEIDEIFLAEILELRAEIFGILEDENLNFITKIKNVFSLTKSFQMLIDGEDFVDEKQEKAFGDCLKILEEMEYINQERKVFVKELKNKTVLNNPLEIYQKDFEKLMKYYIFRYLLKAVYDYDVLTKIKYGVFAAVVISRIYSAYENLTCEDRAKIMYSYSKEVEYSDLNMDLLDEKMYSDFGTEDLINLLLK
ncbi:MAG: flagellin lysine-N-methylase [Clostridia bacterium]|nr:flagellin lysine-N-methylase [Clostridia bacterium]